MGTKLLSVIVPVYNESLNIEYLVGELNKAYSKTEGFEIEIIFVDDGSVDDSFQKLKSMHFGDYYAILVKLSKNYGAHAAVRAGNQVAKGDYITFQGADLQETADLPIKLYEKISEGYDLVWAIRRSSKIGFFEKLFSRFYAALMKKYAFKNYPKTGLDICIYNQKIQQQLSQNIESNSSVQLQILSLGYKYTSIEYDKRDRQHGKSKWTISKKVKLLIDSFIAFSYAPIRFVTVMGFGFFIAGSIFMIYVIWRKVFIGDLNTGWPALVSILFMGFGVTNISLGIIAEYLWRTLDASRKRPVFIIDEIVDMSS